MRDIESALDKAAEDRQSGGMIITGKYGEGKTHLLNTVFDMASEKNMAVSLVTLSKETPVYKLPLLYQKIMQNTYLPGRVQPGVERIFENISLNAPVAQAMFEYALTSLMSDKLYYVLKSYLGTGDEDERFLLLADMEGDFLSNGDINRVYRRVFSKKATYKAPFYKTQHSWDYMSFMSRLFVEAGLQGWVILFDETELIGRLSKKARINSYLNIMNFLKPENLTAVFSMFAFTASYVPDVIDAKHEYANMDAAGLQPGIKERAEAVLDLIGQAPQLAPLSDAELLEVLGKIQDYHSTAFDWTPNIDARRILEVTEKNGGKLLRAKIRTTIEMFDQLYQYGECGNISLNSLGEAGYEEDASLEELAEM
jgi:hypothetical protein